MKAGKLYKFLGKPDRSLSVRLVQVTFVPEGDIDVPMSENDAGGVVALLSLGDVFLCLGQKYKSSAREEKDSFVYLLYQEKIWSTDQPMSMLMSRYEIEEVRNSGNR